MWNTANAQKSLYMCCKIVFAGWLRIQILRMCMTLAPTCHNMEKSQGGPELGECNVFVTINNRSASSNVGRTRGGRQLVTITPLPLGATVRPPFIIPTPHARFVVVRPAANLVSVKHLLVSVILQHSGGPWQVKEHEVRQSGFKGKYTRERRKPRNLA